MSAVELDGLLDVQPRPQEAGTPEWLPTVRRLVAEASELSAEQPDVPPSTPDAATVFDGQRPRYKQVDSYHLPRNPPPPHLRDPAQWGEWDPSVLSTQVLEGETESDFDRCQRRQAAILDYCKHEDLTLAATIAGTAKPEFLRIYNRCLYQDQFGRPWGFASLPKGAHCGSARRLPSGASPTQATGKRGDFRAFMEAYPEVFDVTIDAIDPPSSKTGLASGSFAVVYQAFYTACKAAGLTDNDYPLRSEDGAQRSVRRLIEDYLNANPEAFEYWYGVGASEHLLVSRLSDYFELARHPYGDCMIDAHRVDVQSTIVMQTDLGPMPILIKRFWLVVAACRRSSSDAVIGFSFSLEDKPSAETVERAVLRAQTPWTPRPLCGGLAYEPGAGLPNGVIEGLDNAPITRLTMDNDSAHWARVNQEDLRRNLGCHLVYGPVRKWFTNARLERLFKALNQAGLHVLPSTLGTGPQDKKRPRNPGKAAVDASLDFTFLRDLIEVVLTGMNAQKRYRLWDRSPLEICRNQMTLGEYRWLPRPSAPPSPFAPRLGWVREWVRIAGSKHRGVAPYIDHYGVRYESPDSKSRYDLIGSRVLRWVRRADSAMEVYFEDGRPMRELRARGKAQDIPMPLSVKASCYNSKNRKKVPALNLQVALQHRMNELSVQAVKDAEKHRYRISPAANELAQLFLHYDEYSLRPPQGERGAVPHALSPHARPGQKALEATCADEAAPHAPPARAAHGEPPTSATPAVPYMVIPLRPVAHFNALNSRPRR